MLAFAITNRRLRGDARDEHGLAAAVIAAQTSS